MASNLISIGGIWLTDDATSMGFPCRTVVEGLSSLKLTYRGNVTPSADNSQHFNIVDLSTRGANITIRFESVLLTDVFDDLNTLFDQAFTDRAPFDVIIDGETGNFAFQAVSDPNQPMNFGIFETGYISDVIIFLKTV